MLGKGVLILLCVLGDLPVRAEVPQTQEVPASAPSAHPGDATLLTVDVKDQPIVTVLQQVSRDSGMEVVLLQYNPNPKPLTITLSAHARPFWEVINQICLRCNGDCFVSAEGRVEILAGDPSARPITSVAGPLQLTVVGVKHLFDLTAAEPEYCAVSIRALFEPKLKVLFYENVMAPDEAADENGHPLIPAAGVALDDPRQSPNFAGTKPDHFTMIAGPASRNLEWTVRLAVPPGAGRRIALLRGSLRLWVAEQLEMVETDHLEQLINKPKTIRLTDGTEMSIQEEKQRNTLSFRLGTLRRDLPAGEWDMRVRRLHLSGMSMVDADGRQSPLSSGWEMSSLTEHSMSFSAISDPVKVIAQIPTLKEVQIPFSLHDLPLP